MGKTDEPLVSARLQSLADRLAEKFTPDGPGCSILITQDGKTLLRKGYGLANLEWQIPVLPDTVFRVGSVTKQFTAVSILMLLEQGKLSLQDPIEKFIPDYPTQGHRITIEHLLTHTSGIKSYTEMKNWPGDWGKDFSLDELIAYFKNQPMGFAPGQKWAYNNSGYVLLGAIIENCAQKPYNQFLQDSIFKPLKMESTCLELPGMLILRRASGYSKSPTGYVPAAYISMTQPLAAGGVVSTIGDLASWDAALYGDKLISAENMHRAHTPVTLPDGSSTHYGFGWAIHDFEGIEVLEHGGGIHGFACHMLRIPSERFLAVALTNCDNPALNPNEITFDAVLKALGKTYSEPQQVELEENQLSRFVGKYEIEPGALLTITVENGGLNLVWPGEDKAGTKIIPIGQDEFVNPDIRFTKFRLHADGTGSKGWIELINQYQEVRLKAQSVAA
jgi:D-alanyl-D-alanine carboxypeptidase